MRPRHEQREKNIRLDFYGGGWVILLAILTLAALVAWRVIPSIREGGTPYRISASDAPYNGFDVSTSLVKPEHLVSGMPRDTLLPLDDPATVPADGIEAINEKYRKYLLPGDRVVGVRIGDQARAYPLRVLAWHEVCNDTLGGVPIAVTYSPLCDSVVVFDRRVAGRTLSFGVSGLLYNSNLLMYDRPEGDRPASLWCQLWFRAVTGPAAGEKAVLTVLPAQVVYWADWAQAHPDTTVVAPEPDKVKRYRREPYSSYYGRGRPRYPQMAMPAGPVMPLFTPVIAVQAGGQGVVYPLPLIEAKAGPQGEWTTTWQDVRLRFVYRHEFPDPPVAWVMAEGEDGSDVRTIHAFWFAWRGLHPTDAVVVPDQDR